MIFSPSFKPEAITHWSPRVPSVFTGRASTLLSAPTTITLAFFSMFGMFFLLTQYLQFVKGYSPLAAGVRVLPNAAALMLVAPRAPRFIERFGVRAVLRTGFFLTSFGFALLATAGRSTSTFVVLVALVFTGGASPW